MSAEIETLIAALKARAQTLSCAESCTGGLISARICAYPGVSKIFMGAVVSYSLGSKENLLDVPPTLNKSVGAVSTPVALAMARGARLKLKSTWSVSVTGIAGPDGGTPTKPVGLVCFAVCGPGLEEVSTQHFKGSRTEIQNLSANYAIEFLLKMMN